MFPTVKKVKCPCCGEELAVELEIQTRLTEIYVRTVKDHIDSKREEIKWILMVDDAELDRRIQAGEIPRGIWEGVVGKEIEQRAY